MSINNWQTTGLTDKGNVRSRNEDSLYLNDEQRIWVVADGAGGHANGDLASQATTKAFHHYTMTGRIGSDARQVSNLLQNVNRQLIEMQEKSGQVSASTVSVVISNDQSLVCLWSGDSPIYRLRDNRFVRLTQDHNREEVFIQQGFTAKECEQIPHAQHLTQALGASEFLCLQTRIVDVYPSDCILICSDGITKELRDDEIYSIMQEYRYSSKHLSHELQSRTLERGARDNTTALVIIAE